MHVEGAEHDRIGMLNLGGDFIALARKTVETHGGYVVVSQYLEHRFHPYLRSNSAMKASRASTPLSGMAL